MCPPDSFPDCMGLKNRIFFDKVCKNLQVPPMGELRPQLGARKGKCGPNLTTKISKSKICDFPKLAPERSWGIAGMVGRAETCSKHRARARLADRSFLMHDVVPQWLRNGQEGQGRSKTHYEIFEIEKTRFHQTTKISKTYIFGFTCGAASSVAVRIRYCNDFQY